MSTCTALQSALSVYFSKMNKLERIIQAPQTAFNNAIGLIPTNMDSILSAIQANASALINNVSDTILNLNNFNGDCLGALKDDLNRLKRSQQSIVDELLAGIDLSVLNTLGRLHCTEDMGIYSLIGRMNRLLTCITDNVCATGESIDGYMSLMDSFLDNNSLTSEGILDIDTLTTRATVGLSATRITQVKNNITSIHNTFSSSISSVRDLITF